MKTIRIFYIAITIGIFGYVFYELVINNSIKYFNGEFETVINNKIDSIEAIDSLLINKIKNDSLLIKKLENEKKEYVRILNSLKKDNEKLHNKLHDEKVYIKNATDSINYIYFIDYVKRYERSN